MEWCRIRIMSEEQPCSHFTGSEALSNTSERTLGLEDSGSIGLVTQRRVTEVREKPQLLSPCAVLVPRPAGPSLVPSLLRSNGEEVLPMLYLIYASPQCNPAVITTVEVRKGGLREVK